MIRMGFAAAAAALIVVVALIKISVAIAPHCQPSMLTIGGTLVGGCAR